MVMNTMGRNFHFWDKLDSPASDEYFLLHSKGQIQENFVYFQPGTYHVVLDSSGKEILPSPEFASANHKLWLQGQQCPSPCTWIFKGKQAHEIILHVSTCKFRNYSDPLKKLCTLWRAKRSRN
ncbi:hypothetical protein BT69DRAFT_1277564 [Atractiella rhizophila]|nr:hypothetical protein BT69DRAFT_1277564 [Atractiella rhizophila]